MFEPGYEGEIGTHDWGGFIFEIPIPEPAPGEVQAHFFFAGPDGGPPEFPTFRPIQPDDIPFGVTNLTVLPNVNALRPITTVGVTVETQLRFVDESGTVFEWFLIAGTNPDDPPNGYVRPDDYANVTNEKVWHRMVTPGNGIATAIRTIRVIPISEDADPIDGDVLTYDPVLDAWKPSQFQFLQDPDDNTKRAVFDISDVPHDTEVNIHIAGISGATTVVPIPDQSGSNLFASGLDDQGNLIFASPSGIITSGDLTDVGTDGITITGGTGAVLGSGTSLSQHVSDATHNGYLSSTDWNSFNTAAIGGITGAGNLSPLFTTSISAHTLNFALSNASAHTFFANNTGSSGAPSFTSFVAGTDYEVPLTGSKSITRTANDFALTNDSTTPGNSKYYGTDSGGTRGYFALPSGATGANPTASVGLTVVNGVLTTFMRSDAAPPLDVTISPNWTGAHSFTGGSIIVTTQGTTDNSTKAASTEYVTTAISNAIAGVNPAVAVQAATTAASDTSAFTYLNGVGGIGATLTGPTANTAVVIDGFTFTAVGQRLLVKDDTQSPSGAFNGVYFLSTLQAPLIKPVFTRALDYDMPSDINNTGAIPVVNGTVNGTTSWVLTSNVTTVGTDPLTFTEFSLKPSTLVQTSRTLTIGGVAHDLSADRSWMSTITGWTAPTGTSLRTGYATTTATLDNVAQTLKALIDDLFTQGLIGT